MKTRYSRELGDKDEHEPLYISAARFSQTPLGRAALHLECLIHHPGAARFYINGLTRNLRESAISSRRSVLKSWRKTFGRSMKEKPLRDHFGESSHRKSP
jgi:hypothetical protein